MSAPKHTPGPWSAEPESGGYHAVVEALTADRRYVVREICHVLIDEADPGDWPVTRANLRLIAAAPDLLEALTLILEHVGGVLPVPVSDAASDALKKARGE